MSNSKMSGNMLKSIHLFSKLPDSEREKLIEILHPVELPNDAIICREGDLGDRMFVILSGEVEVIKAIGTSEEHRFGILHGGDYVGEMSLLERGGRRTATVRTKSPVTLLEMPRDEFDDLLKQHPSLAIEMLREVSLRLRDTQSATIRDLQEKNLQLAQAYRELQAAQAQIIEKEKLERELQLAQEIQMSMLPSALPETHGYEFGARILPARAVGGDLFDFILLDSMQKIGVLIGDVSDKGVPAALFMALTRSLLRAEASLDLSPLNVLRKVNFHLQEMNKSSMFVSMLYGVLVPEMGEFHYARAGHEIPILLDEDGRSIEVSQAPGQLLGIFKDPMLDDQSIVIPHGGVLLLFTDGATDASNLSQEFFGNENLVKTLQNNRIGSAQEICDRVFNEILNFQGEASQLDDITLVVVRSI